MDRLKLFFPLVLLTLISCGESRSVTADYNVIPLPQNIQLVDEEGFAMNKATQIVYPSESDKLRKAATFLSDYIHTATGLTLEISDKIKNKNVILLQVNDKNENEEHYSLTVNSQSIVINGASEAGVFYGIQTLRKSIPVDSFQTDVLFPAVSIKDYPRFAYRGMHLDVSRHMFPIEFIKKYVDLIAMHNMNKFHWHLTDDQGWRIEIKKYPELTEKGSMRKETLIGHLQDKPQKFDNKPYGGFYTQDEAREIVAYAADRFITIIPEIDLPGHMLAALSAYPELGCTGGPYETGTKWGVFDDVLCAGNEKTFDFLENVFSELIEIFPSEYIHVGGDECPKTRWKTCSKCQARIKEQDIKRDKEHSAEDKLQNYFISRAAKFLNSKGRQIIGWDEILEGGLAPNATVMAWRGKEAGKTAAKLHHHAIMVPYEFLYFDYNQGPDKSKEPLSIGGFLSVEKVYRFEPLPEGLAEEERKYIVGVQGNLWTEYITSAKLAEYMALPRMDALSEIQWLEPEKKDFDSFKIRFNSMRKLYDKLGYNYAVHVFENN